MRISEIFLSIQGETSYTGLPTAFIRTTGCPLRCVWCDTAYAFQGGEEWTVEALLQKVEAWRVPNVVVTGGEPLAQEEVYALLEALVERGYTALLETGGSLSVARVDPRVIKILDIKCPGSGMTRYMDWSNLDHLTPRDEVKFVLLDRPDYEWARSLLQEDPRLKIPHILFSPVHGRLDPALLAQWILEDRLPVRLQIQLHKILWGPEARGV